MEFVNFVKEFDMMTGQVWSLELLILLKYNMKWSPLLTMSKVKNSQ